MVQNGFRNYPTPSNVSYFINGYRVDDIFRVDFQRKTNHQPIYGYDDELYSFVAKGKELVYGNIIINFRYPGYLRNAIIEFSQNAYERDKLFDQKVGMNGDVDILDAKSIVDFIDTSGDIGEQSQVLANFILNPNQYNDQNPAAARLRQVANGVGSNNVLISALKESYYKKLAAQRGELDLYHSYESPLDIPKILPFDLEVKYNSGNENGIFTRIFKDIVLTGEEETVSASSGGGNDMSSSAQPILEVYSFFAKTIKTETPRS
jgi:hypothetical protein